MSLSAREARLQRLAEEVTNRYPFYREWAKPGLAFADLPLLTKTIVNEHRDRLRLPLREPFRETFTSGSTGIPFSCIKTAEEQMKLSMAIHRHRRKWGLPFKHRSVLLGNMLFAYPRMVPQYANQIVRSAPHMIQGRCSALDLLAQYFSDKRMKVPDTLRFVQNWGESVQPAQRGRIESVFQVPLLDYYGMEEIWLIAFSNEKGDLALDEQLVHAEVIDPATGRPVPEGDIGEIVVTSFAMKSMPFVRYRTGDMGSVHEGGTAGGRIIRLLPFRTSQIKLPDRAVDASIFRYLDHFFQQLAADIGVKQFQMVQESYTSFRLLIVAPAAGEERLREATLRLETLLKQTLCVERLHILIEHVPRIAPHPVSGKFQPFVSLVS